MLRASSRGLCATLSYRVTGWQCAARTMSTRMGYTLSPYEDADREGYRRGSEFCLLTLQHPEYDVDDTMELRELYTEKADVAAQHLDEAFVKGAQSSGALDESQLSEVLAAIGLPPTNEQIRSELLRLEAETPELQREELADLLRETWGGIVYLDVRDDLDLLYTEAASLNKARRGLTWLGRSVSVNWLLHALRHSWPAHVESVSLMRNVAPNQCLDPAFMEELGMPSAPGASTNINDVADVTTVLDLAAAAAAAPPTAMGGISVRLTLPDGATVYVPLLGLPVNERSFQVGPRRSWREKLAPLAGPAAFVLACAVGFAWLESAKKQNEARRRNEA